MPELEQSPRRGARAGAVYIPGDRLSRGGALAVYGRGAGWDHRGVFERFTERARLVVVRAQEETRAFKHNYIGTEHILLGPLREEEGLAARVLESLDVTVERVHAGIVCIVGSGEEVTSGQIPFTPRAKKVLELALREGLSLGHAYIGTEHILLGLVCEDEGVAARILLDLDASSEKIRIEVIRMLSGSGEELTSGQSPSRSSPSADRELEEQIESARGEREAALEAQDFEKAAALRDKERKLTNRRVQISEPRLGPPRRVGRFHAEGARPVLVWDRATMLWRPEGLELPFPCTWARARSRASPPTRFGAKSRSRVCGTRSGAAGWPSPLPPCSSTSIRPCYGGCLTPRSSELGTCAAKNRSAWRTSCVDCEPIRPQRIKRHARGHV